MMKVEKIKVLQVNKLYYPKVGGIEKVVQQIAEGLKDRTEMKVLVCNEQGGKVCEKINGVCVQRSVSMGIFFSTPISFSFLYSFRKLAREQDIVHLHMPFPLGDLACFLSGFRGKIVIWWHSDIVRQQKLLKIYKPLMKWMLNRADTIIVATEGHIEHSEYLKKYK